MINLVLLVFWLNVVVLYGFNLDTATWRDIGNDIRNFSYWKKYKPCLLVLINKYANIGSMDLNIVHFEFLPCSI